MITGGDDELRDRSARFLMTVGAVGALQFPRGVDGPNRLGSGTSGVRNRTMDSASGGKRPKSADAIREKLARVHDLAERPAEVGPYAAGLKGTDRFPVATFYDAACAAAYQERLLKAGIHSAGERRLRRSAVLVDVEDRRRAVEILQAHLAQFPDRVRRPGRGLEATLFLTLVGLMSLIVVLVADDQVDERGALTAATVWRSLRITGGFTLHLAFVGLLIDMIRSGKLDFGRSQFNLIFVLWLTAAVALMIYWR